METDSFLLLASLDVGYSGKVLIKKLYDSDNEFLFKLFTSELGNFKDKLTSLEIEKIEYLKTEIKKLNLDKIKRSLDELGVTFLPISCQKYPAKLKELGDPPVGLFCRGNLELFRCPKAVAIVGTRDATNYGINISKKIASLLSSQGIVVISGLAAGIDTSAHLGSLESGKTIAVLGTGIDIVFPVSNEKLYQEILDKKGLIISEYPPGSPGVPWNFPQRNRIISVLSDAVVVIEGNIQSGALITARFAIKQGRHLFALPGPIDAPTSNGPNLLIKSKAAELLTSVDDILEKIGEGKQTKLDLNENNNEILNGLSKEEKDIYKLLSSQAKNFDNLLLETDLSVQELTIHLSILELKGFIKKIVEGGYVRC